MAQANSHPSTKPTAFLNAVARTEYTSDDLASDLQHLFDLVDTVVDSLVEIDRSNMDCAGQNELNRVGSLAWITRDQLELIRDRVFQENDGVESAKPPAGRKESRA
jgi:hypothetical protein